MIQDLRPFKACCGHQCEGHPRAYPLSQQATNSFFHLLRGSWFLVLTLSEVAAVLSTVFTRGREQ